MTRREARWLARLLAWCAAACLGSAAAQAPDERAEPALCLPDQPMLVIGQRVALHLWAASVPAGRTRWQVESGTVEVAADQQVQWTVTTGAAGQVVRATAFLDTDAGSTPLCTTQVTLVLPGLELKGPRLLDRTLFLYPGSTLPVDGYGLYSYLLLPKPAVRGSDAERRILAELAELLRFPDLEDIKAGTGVQRRRSLHLIQLLLREPPGPELERAIDARDWMNAARWVLDHYDHRSSRRLAEDIDEIPAPDDGPYFVSFDRVHHVDGVDEDLPRPYLVQDHSLATERLARIWINAFLNQAWQDTYWQPRPLERVYLRTRTMLEYTARATGSLGESLLTGISRAVHLAR